jgi:hypothetical protein
MFFATVTMKNVIFLGMTLCGLCYNRHFGGSHHPHHQCGKISKLGITLTVTSN